MGMPPYYRFDQMSSVLLAQAKDRRALILPGLFESFLRELRQRTDLAAPTNVVAVQAGQRFSSSTDSFHPTNGISAGTEQEHFRVWR